MSNNIWCWWGGWERQRGGHCRQKRRTWGLGGAYVPQSNKSIQACIHFIVSRRLLGRGMGEQKGELIRIFCSARILDIGLKPFTLHIHYSMHKLHDHSFLTPPLRDPDPCSTHLLPTSLQLGLAGFTRFLLLLWAGISGKSQG